ncbi:phage major capsid protein [Tardiphaga sp. 709]|uniref:phage major capsid protein n=1 Tax=Tardiphaga sp. 709 TaxID=3076039 RepID=UPI0028EA203F|nr:phage major capsid protein [Tardiphaga sp. 709]WNV09959.1 phage major capsid protein [Tardiphaga sp. 709]
MASPNPSVDDIVATTIENRSKKAADNVTRNNALLNRLAKQGNTRAYSPIDGGTTIWEEIEYALNGTTMWYSGYETLNIAPQQIFTSAIFQIRQAAVAVSISGLEELQNSGEERMIDLIGGRVSNAERSLESLIATGIYSDGTTPKSIGGLQQLISKTPATGSVGGIDPATWVFWRNIAFSSATDGGAPATAANIKGYMDAVANQLVRGTDKADLIPADNNYWELYNQSLQAIQRTEQVKTGESGFESLKYRSADVILDGGFQGYSTDPIPVGGVPVNTMYFINSRYLKYRPHRDRNFNAIGPKRMSVNQDASVKLMGWAGNMTISNRRLQGVLGA